MDRVFSLLERDEHIDALDGWFREVAAGNGRIVFVGGEAGIGKSALLDRFTQLAHGRARVLRGACDMMSTPRPLAPVLDFAAAIGGSFDRLLTSDFPRDHIFRATLIELSGGITPTVAIIEDAHWADEATLDLLRFLGRRLDTSRILLVVTYRDDEVGPSHPLRVVLGDLATAKATRRLKLEPLTVEGVAELVRQCPNAPNVNPIALHEMTGGNPFFASEALFSGTVGLGQIPSTVRDAVLSRSSRLSPAAYKTLEAAAVIGASISDQMLRRVADDSSEALEECLSGGMLVPAGDHAYAFRHELARAAIYDTIRPMRRRNLHAEVLEELREGSVSSLDFSLVAHHADAAADCGAVLEFGLEAAKRAVCLRAHREAVAQFARVMRYAHALPAEERALILEDYAFERFLTGDIEDAIELRGEALRIWRKRGDRVREGNSLRSMSRFYWYLGRSGEAVKAADDAIAILESLPPGRELALALSIRSQLHMLASESSQAIALGKLAGELANAVGDTGIFIHASINIGTAQLLLGDLTGRMTLERSLALALDEDLDDHATRAYTNLSWNAIGRKDFHYAQKLLAQAIEYATDRDLDSGRAYLVSCRSHLRLLMGDWKAALEDADSILSKPKVAAVTRITALMVRGLVTARRGDSGAAEILAEALELAQKTGEIQRLRPVRTALAEAAWLSGDQQLAAIEVNAVRKLTLELGTRWDLGELAVWLQRSGVVPETYAEIVNRALPAPYRLALVGDWVAAADSWESLGCPYDQAMALLDGDECALRESLAIFQQLGAQAAEAIASRRLRQLGARGIPRGPRPATRSNPASLTTRELELLPYLVEGRQNIEIANRLFLSAKTVEHHISKIFSKLNIHARNEVSTAVSRLGIELCALEDRAAD